MTIDLSDVLSCENKVVTEQASLEMRTFSSRMGEFPVSQDAPAELLIANHEDKRMTVDGDVRLTLVMPCSRCLAEVETPLAFAIHRDWPISEGVVCGGEDEDAGCVEGAMLDADALVSQEILVHFPEKVLCREDCKGICPVCGHNLNEGDCGCQREVLDPRMAAIQDVFKQFNAD